VKNGGWMKIILMDGFPFFQAIRLPMSFPKNVPMQEKVFLFFAQNFNLKKEVMGKYDLPYAQNLDEAPK